MRTNTILPEWAAGGMTENQYNPPKGRLAVHARSMANGTLLLIVPRARVPPASRMRPLSSGAQAMYLPVVGWLRSREMLAARMGGVGRSRLFFGGSKVVWIGRPTLDLLLRLGQAGRAMTKVSSEFRCTGWNGGR